MMKSKLPPQLHTLWDTDKAENGARFSPSSVSPENAFLQKLCCSIPLWIRQVKCNEVSRAIQDSLNKLDVWWIRPCSTPSHSNSETVYTSTKPKDIGQISYKWTPNIDEMSPFASLEIACCEMNSNPGNTTLQGLDSLNVQWPVDVETPTQFQNKIRVLKSLFNRSISIGISIPLVNPSSSFFDSLQWMSHCQFDWITWRLPSACLGEDHLAVHCFSDNPFETLHTILRWQEKIFPDRNSSPAIAIEYPWKSGFEAAQIIREGAQVAVLPGNCRMVEKALQDYKQSNEDPSSHFEVFPGSSFGSTSTHKPTSYSHGKSFSFPDPSSNKSAEPIDRIQSVTAELIQFVMQMNALLEWSR